MCARACTCASAGERRNTIRSDCQQGESEAKACQSEESGNKSAIVAHNREDRGVCVCVSERGRYVSEGAGE
jgi:hypothetical protein